jgi:hypothetical protein
MKFAILLGGLAAAVAIAITAGTMEAGRIKSGFALSADDELRIYQQVAANSPPNGERAGGFHPAIGSTVPSSVTLESLPGTIAKRIPKVSQYDYVVTSTGLALVDPRTRKVIDVING